MIKYLKDYKNAVQTDGKWVVPLIPVETGIHDIYEEDGVMYQDCPFCGQQNKYDEWSCNRCGAE